MNIKKTDNLEASIKAANLRELKLYVDKVTAERDQFRLERDECVKALKRIAQLSDDDEVVRVINDALTVASKP